MNPKDPYGQVPPSSQPTQGQQPQQQGPHSQQQPYAPQPQPPYPQPPYPQQPYAAQPYPPPQQPHPQQPYPQQPSPQQGPPYAPPQQPFAPHQPPPPGQPPYPQQPPPSQPPYAQPPYPQPYPQPPYAQPYPQPPYAQQPYPQPPYSPFPAPIAPPVAGAAPAVDPRARNAGITLLVCAALVLVGVVSTSWFTARGGGNIGVLGVEECRGAMCKTMTWFDMKRAPGELQLFSAMGLLGGLTAVGFLIHAGVVLLKSQAKRVKLLGLNLSLGIAAFGCTSFLFHLLFGQLSKSLTINWAGFPALAGLIAAGVVLQRTVRPLHKA